MTYARGDAQECATWLDRFFDVQASIVALTELCVAHVCKLPSECTVQHTRSRHTLLSPLEAGCDAQRFDVL